MKILLVLTYYRPHVSGLTIYVQRVAEALAAEGHAVTVLTSRYDASLPAEEKIDGVRVLRVPVLMRVNKGVIMPSFPLQAFRLLRDHDVVSVHLPQFEASLLAFLGRLIRRPVVLTYHCDLRLPVGLFNRLVDRIISLSNYLAGAWADAVVAYTEDYARHSAFLSRFPHKLHIIPPPVDMPQPEGEAVQAYKKRFGLGGKAVIGFAGRFATEKGVEYLLGAMPQILRQIPSAHVLFAGEYDNVIGEEQYKRRLQPLLEKYGDHWTLLGVLDPEEMAIFYTACDVTVLPSINSTESFGLVQVESMLCGTPVCATDLPGVRVAVKTTGMGEIVPPCDSSALAQALIKVLRKPQDYRRAREQIVTHYSTERTCQAYLQLFALLRERQHRSIPIDGLDVDPHLGM
jgi:glycosyltransferase involved in cell wall biosynthesis